MKRSSLLTTAGLLLAPLAGWSADAFYLNLLRTGESYQAAGDLSNAEGTLRIACFGLLDEPPVLARCLAVLAVVEDASGDGEGFRATFDRLVEVEERFGGYSSMQLPDALRTALESALTRRVPHRALEGVAAFAALVPSESERLQGLSTADRRRELERKMAAEPHDSTWPAMLGDLELAAGRDKRALRSYESALRIDPENRAAHLGLATIATSARDWRDAATHLEASGAAATDPTVAALLVQALVEAGQPQAALDAAAELPADMQADPAVEAELSRAAGMLAPPPDITQAVDGADGGATDADQEGPEHEAGPTTSSEVAAASADRPAGDTQVYPDTPDDLDPSPHSVEDQPPVTEHQPPAIGTDAAAWTAGHDAESEADDELPDLEPSGVPAPDAVAAPVESATSVTRAEELPTPTPAPAAFGDGARAPDPADPPAGTTGPGPDRGTRPPATASSLLDLRVQSTGARTVLTVTADGQILTGSVRHSRLTNPPRHLIRISGVSLVSWPYLKEIGDGRVRSVRAAVHPEHQPPEVHLVVDRENENVVVTSVRVSGRVLLIEVE